MAQALIGRPGWPPGKSQGESVWARTAWLRRAETCRRASSATGPGRATATSPRRMRTVAAVSSI
ncbi:hypothetical protein AB0A77_36365 [Streptomyces varsoviensis]|uniref:hypothetical protein n=1 Tax=Streptomyces varsoviensis TaxID=67373 RepID=UPI0033D79242